MNDQLLVVLKEIVIWIVHIKLNGPFSCREEDRNDILGNIVEVFGVYREEDLSEEVDAVDFGGSKDVVVFDHFHYFHVDIANLLQSSVSQLAVA